MSGDPFDLGRFVAAQARVYPEVLAELNAGAKRTHWMWFVFPQLAGLGRSEMARFYAIRGVDEAAAYLAHPVLGARLRECVAAAVGSGVEVHRLFGSPDDVKFRSSMTLFERVSGEAGFGEALDRLCGGERDGVTLALLDA